MRALTLVAITHHGAPFSILERVSLDADAADALALELRRQRGIDEAIVLATCNRTELYLAATPDHADIALELLADHAGVPTALLRDVADVLDGEAASRHLFRVAAGLESRIIGEREILGQVRATAARAADHGAAGPSLLALFRWASATGRRARRDAGGPAAPSLACTALDAAGPLGPDDLVIVLGAGTMAAAVTNELRARHLRYLVAARRPDRAARLTRRPQDAIALDRLHDHLDGVDLVVCATSARTPVLDRRTVATRPAQRARPLTVVDLSMPRNVDPGVGELDGIELIHLEQLRGGDDLHARRASDAVAAEHQRYQLWLAGQTVGPLIAALRRRITDICADEALRHLPVDQAAQLARRTAGKVLHAPTLALKELAAGGETAALDALAQALGVDTSTPLAQDDAIAAVS